MRMRPTSTRCSLLTSTMPVASRLICRPNAVALYTIIFPSETSLLSHTFGPGVPVELPGRCKRLECPLQNTQTIGDHDPVIGDGNPHFPTVENAVEHLPPIGHAGSAMDHKSVGG